MPYQKTRRSRYAKRGTRRTKRWNRMKSKGAVVNMVRQGQVVPPRLIVKLPYNDYFTRSSVSAIEDYQFNLNSIYDPNRTGTGHQPLGHDQYNNFYNRYRVYKAKVIIDWTQGGGGGTHCCLVANNNTTTFTDLNTAIENPVSTHKPWGSGKTTRIVKTFKLNNIVGRDSKAYRADDRFQAEFGASPAENLILHVVTADANAGTFQYAFNIKIIYYCELFDHTQLTQS